MATEYTQLHPATLIDYEYDKAVILGNESPL